MKRQDVDWNKVVVSGHFGTGGIVINRLAVVRLVAGHGFRNHEYCVVGSNYEYPD